MPKIFLKHSLIGSKPYSSVSGMGDWHQYRNSTERKYRAISLRITSGIILLVFYDQLVESIFPSPKYMHTESLILFFSISILLRPSK